MRFCLSGLASGLLAVMLLITAVPAAAVDRKPERTAAEQNAALGRGVNFGGILEAPDALRRAPILDRRLFSAVREGGFSTIRLPVRFSAHASTKPPYILDEAFMRIVDSAVRNALSEKLNVIIDFHHYVQMDGDPPADGDKLAELSDEEWRQRFLAIWRQLGERYRSMPTDRVLFEIYNEPHGKTDNGVWNDLIARTLPVIRESNPDRFVIVDAGDWAVAWALEDLVIPKDDRRLIVSIHNYAPFHFTHQGASWIENSTPWVGTGCCSDAQMKEIREPLDIAEKWGKDNDRPIFVGEFGAISIAAYADRVRYARFMRDEAEKRGFSWAWWDFSSDEFGPWDGVARLWRKELRDALSGK